MYYLHKKSLKKISYGAIEYVMTLDTEYDNIVGVWESKIMLHKSPYYELIDINTGSNIRICYECIAQFKDNIIVFDNQHIAYYFDINTPKKLYNMNIPGGYIHDITMSNHDDNIIYIIVDDNIIKYDFITNKIVCNKPFSSDNMLHYHHKNIIITADWQMYDDKTLDSIGLHDYNITGVHFANYSSGNYIAYCCYDNRTVCRIYDECTMNIIGSTQCEHYHNRDNLKILSIDNENFAVVTGLDVIMYDAASGVYKYDILLQKNSSFPSVIHHSSQTYHLRKDFIPPYTVCVDGIMCYRSIIIDFF